MLLLSLVAALAAPAPPPHAAVHRSGDCWVIENSVIAVTVDARAGRLSVRDSRNAYTWSQAYGTPGGFRDVREAAGVGAGLRFVAEAGADGPPVRVETTVPDDAAELHIQVSLDDPEQTTDALTPLAPFVLEEQPGFIIAAQYGDGVLVETDDMVWSGNYWTTYRGIDMPWVGLTDLKKGYALIVETPFDAAIRLDPTTVGDAKLLAPNLVWEPCKGRFAYPRRCIYSFHAEGGHVALAKRYRAYAQAQGLVRTLREKAEANPEVRKLMGAPDIWGADGLAFCRDAKLLGVDKALVNGRWSAEDMRAMVEMGYLVSEYDNYVDIQPVAEGAAIDSNHAPIPGHCLKHPDGSPVVGWITYDKSQTYMKRCSALAPAAARSVVEKVLGQFPFNARFLDVSTADTLFECYDAEHPMTREDDARHRMEMAQVLRDRELVVGGEHGIFWAVPNYEYFEGMMSGGHASWPAGHLMKPESREGISDEYRKYGIGHAHRAPLWELVFHDCAVTTWYWGDATGWLYELDPAIVDKQDAFNALYGTVPLMWAGGSDRYYPDHRERFLQSYRNTCKLHEQIGYDEMLSHEFVTPDRAVQRTRFASGVAVTANFGEAPFAVDADGQTYQLPTNGFIATDGQGHVIQFRADAGSGLATVVRAPGYVYAEAPAGDRLEVDGLAATGNVTCRSPGANRVTVRGTGSVTLRPGDVVPEWDPATTIAFVRDAQGNRTGRFLLAAADDQVSVELPAQGDIELVCGPQAELPDLAIEADDVQAVPATASQGDEVVASIVVRNAGGSTGDGDLICYLDRIDDDHEIAAEPMQLDPGRTRSYEVHIDTAPMDGTHRFIARFLVGDPSRDLLLANNVASADFSVEPDFARWPHSIPALALAGNLARRDTPVSLSLDLSGELGEGVAVDPASVRVAQREPDGRRRMLPSQFEPSGAAAGTVAWVLDGETPAHAGRQVSILFAPKVEGTRWVRPHGGAWDPVTQTIKRESYSVRLAGGVFSALIPAGMEESILSALVYSSGQTGWVTENGEPADVRLVADGPVRTVVSVHRKLKGGTEYEKRYAFYAKHFTVDASVTGATTGCICRAFYTKGGQFEDDKGHRAAIDGKGDAEDVSGANPGVRWYAVYADKWAHSCVALSPASNLTYWDSGAMGGISLDAADAADYRVAYVIHEGRPDASFAAEDYQQLSDPPITMQVF